MKNIFIVILYVLALVTPAFSQVNKTVSGAIFPNASPVKNYVKNSNAEVNILSITNTSNIVTRGTPGLFDNADFKIHATAAGQKVKWPTYSFDPGVTGNCEAYGTFSGDASQYEVYVEDGSGNKLTAPTTLANYTLPQYSLNPKPIISVPYLCTSGSALVVESLAAGAAIDVDNVANGLPVHFGSAVVAPAQFLGSVTVGGTCGWSQTPSTGSFHNFSATTGCTYTATGALAAPSTIIPGFSIPGTINPGTIQVVANGYMGKQGGNSGDGFLALSDGTNLTSQQVFVNAAASFLEVGNLNGQFTYTTAQSALTIQIQAAVGTSTVQMGVGSSAANNLPLLFNVYYFPAAANATVIYANTPPLPTYTRLTSGSGTYTTPQGVKYLKVKMVGGGGGGGSSGTASTSNGADGGATTFGTSLLSAGGGFGNSAGGTATITSPAISILNVTGGMGSGGQAIVATGTYQTGGSGGSSCFGGAAGGSRGATAASAYANSGSGGAGSGLNSVANSSTGNGGGAGACLEAQINSPASSYSYCIGNSGAACTGGAGATAGTSGFAGGAGGTGYIEIEELYNSPGATAFVKVPPTVSIVTPTSHSGGFSANSSGTYTPPVGVTYIEVEMVGGGGGGQGGSSTGGAPAGGGAGGNTTFGTSLMTANGGTGGLYASAPTPAGVSISSPGITIKSFSGGIGAGGWNPSGLNTSTVGGQGASTPFGGGGGGTLSGPGISAAANSGSGGGGGAGGTGGATTEIAGSGGSAGAYALGQINSPLATSYSYSVGAAGAAGVATGGSGQVGGAGGAGQIIVHEYYN